jgi:hypothetical protein
MRHQSEPIISQQCERFNIPLVPTVQQDRIAKPNEMVWRRARESDSSVQIYLLVPGNLIRRAKV